MFCTACGKENKDGYKFCIACGKELKVPAKNSGGSKSAPKHAFNNQGNAPMAPAAEVQPKAAAPKSKDNKPTGARVLKLFNNKGESCEITKFPAVVGKGKDADCKVEGDTNVSRQHVKIHIYGEDKFVCEDLNSTNKTYINGYVLEPEELVILENNDVLMLGKTELKIQY